VSAPVIGTARKCPACSGPAGALPGTQVILVARRPVSMVLDLWIGGTPERPYVIKFGDAWTGSLMVSEPLWLAVTPRVFARDEAGRRVGLPGADVMVAVENCVIRQGDVRRFARPRRSAHEPHVRLGGGRSAITVEVSWREQAPRATGLALQFVFDGHLAPDHDAGPYIGMNA
jgi:hypothetical protein